MGQTYVHMYYIWWDQIPHLEPHTNALGKHGMQQICFCYCPTSYNVTHCQALLHSYVLCVRLIDYILCVDLHIHCTHNYPTQGVHLQVITKECGKLLCNPMTCSGCVCMWTSQRVTVLFVMENSLTSKFDLLLIHMYSIYENSYFCVWYYLSALWCLIRRKL